MVKKRRKPWSKGGSSRFRAEFGLSPVSGGIWLVPVAIDSTRPEFGNPGRFVSDSGPESVFGEQEEPACDNPGQKRMGRAPAMVNPAGSSGRFGPSHGRCGLEPWSTAGSVMVRPGGVFSCNVTK